MNGDATQTPNGHGGQQATAREFLAVVFRRKGVIAGLFLVVTATVLVVAFTRPIEFSSTGRVLVKRGEQESSMFPGRRIGSWEEELATEAQVVRSGTVRARAQALLAAQARRGAPPVEVNTGDIDVQVIGQSNVIEIAYVSRDREAAHLACDAIMSAYVDYRSTSETLPYPKAFFDEALTRVDGAIDSLSRVRRDFTMGHDLVDIEDQQRTQLTLLRGLQHERSLAAATLAEENGNLRIIASLHENPDMDVPIFGSGYINEDALRDLKRSMIQQETKIAQLQERYREDAPELVDARTTLESVRGLLKREVSQRLKLAQAKVQGLRSRVENLDAEIVKIEGQLAEMPAKKARLADLDQQLTVLKARYLDLSHNSDQARVTEQTSRRVSIVVLSPASEGRARNTRDYVRLALAPAFSLVVGIGLAFFIDSLDTRLRTSRDLEDTLDLPVLASLNERKG
jgi:uncharacterized protein involved in exopolysaccharide biosynthesis